MQETFLLSRECNCEHLLKKSGTFHAFTTEADFLSAKPGLLLRGEFGIEVRYLDGDQLSSDRFFPHSVHSAAFIPESALVLDLGAWYNSLFSNFVRLGGTYISARVAEVESNASAVRLWLQGQSVEFDRILICLGIDTYKFAEKVGAKVPVLSELGFHLDVLNAKSIPTAPTLVLPQALTLSPLSDCVRVSGGSHICNPDAPEFAGYLRDFIDAAKQISRHWLVGVPDKRFLWYGFRPSTPDSLPVIGIVENESRVMLAYGHGHLGVTLAAITARILGEIALGKPCSIDISAYAPDRILTNPINFAPL